MKERLTRLYKAGRLDEAGLQKAVDNGWITEEDMHEILAEK